MADPDYTLSSKVFVPKPIDPLETLQGIERYKILQNQEKITGLEAHQKGIDTRALADWKKTRDPMSLEGASPGLRTTVTEGDRGVDALKKETMSRDAHYLLNEKDPEIRKYLWQRKGDDYKRRGWITADTWDKIRDNPNDEALNNIIRGTTSVPEYRRTTGQEADADAAARSRYENREVDPTKPLITPAIRPGGALSGGSPVGIISGTGRTAPVGSVNLTDTQATVVPDPTSPPIGSPAASGKGKIVTAKEDPNPYAKEVPDARVGQDTPTGPGVINQGMDPLRSTARTEGLKRYDTEIAPLATAASKTEASLGTMRAQLESGRGTTDSFTDVRNTLAGIMNAAGVPPETIRGVTGVNLADQEVMKKETVRMGMEYAKNTNGMRQAAQTIQVELAANPSMLTSEAGNLKVIKLMEAGAKYDKEMTKAADAWMKKNDGSLVGFENWWANKYPAAQFMSKVVPYVPPPGGKDKLQNGVTYEVPFKGGKFTGVWNTEAGKFEPK